MERILSSIMYIQNIIQPVLLPLIQQEGNVIFQQYNVHSHASHTT